LQLTKKGIKYAGEFKKQLLLKASFFPKNKLLKGNKTVTVLILAGF